MTIKGATDILTGDTATLLARVLIIGGLAWTGMNQDATKENTEDIKTTLGIIKTRQDAFEQRISRNEVLDASDHSHIRQMVEQNRRDLETFKEKYYYDKSL